MSGKNRTRSTCTQNRRRTHLNNGEEQCYPIHPLFSFVYPIKGNRYFLAWDAGRGFIVTSSNQGAACWLNDNHDSPPKADRVRVKVHTFAPPTVTPKHMRPTTEAFVSLPTQRWEAVPLVAIFLTLTWVLPPRYVSYVRFLSMFLIFVIWLILNFSHFL